MYLQTCDYRTALGVDQPNGSTFLLELDRANRSINLYPLASQDVRSECQSRPVIWRLLDSNEGKAGARNFTQNCKAYMQEYPEGGG